MTMRIGYVVATHPEDHSVDLVMADDGSRLVGVQIVTQNGSTRSGTVDLPAVAAKANKWDITERTDQDMIATVGFVGRIPVVVGFLYPQVNQMLHSDPKLRISRHQSDVITSIDGDGNIQLLHPSGTYIRIGETPDAASVSGGNVDANLAVDRNQARQVHVRVGLAGGAAVLTIAPSGAVTLTTQSTVNVDAQGSATVKASSVTIDSPTTTVTGDLTVSGDTSVQAITSRDKDISSTHRHTNSGGPGTGGIPV